MVEFGGQVADQFDHRLVPRGARSGGAGQYGALAGGAVPLEAADGKSLTLQAELRVPEAAELVLTTPLYKEGDRSPVAVQTRRYRIVGVRS